MLDVRGWWWQRFLDKVANLCFFDIRRNKKVVVKVLILFYEYLKMSSKKGLISEKEMLARPVTPLPLSQICCILFVQTCEALNSK